MYKIANRRRTQRRRRLRFGLIVILLILIGIGFGVFRLITVLHTKPVISQSKAVVTKVSYVGKTKHYIEDNFTIDIPTEWVMLPRPPYTYNSFTWQNVDKANSQSIEVYEDTIPTNFAVNRALIVKGATDHIELAGPASDNCVDFTKDISSGNDEAGVTAKWNGIAFLCNRLTTGRDTIGTSSVDGINTVTLKTTNGTPHSFFFKYTDAMLSPDYTAFYNALTSFGMR